MSKFAAAISGYQEPEPQHIDIEELTGKPVQPIPRDVQLAAARAVVAEGKKPAAPRVKTPAAAPAPTGAKYNDPAFQQLKVYVRRATKTKAGRKWEDEGRGDMSDLIETLLTQYLSS